MEKIDAGYLYELGATVRTFNTIQRTDPAWSVHDKLKRIRDAVSLFTEYSIYSVALRTARTHGQQLVGLIDNMIDHIVENEFAEGSMTKFEGQFMQANATFVKFETVMIAELQALPIFLVPPRGAFDNAYLIERGDTLFPESLLLIAPETELDVMQAGRCIAFNLPTAAGFHMHRANEAVLRLYYDLVMGEGRRTGNATMGTMLAGMKKAEKGDPNIIAALDAIRQFHRNPLMHPEHTLADIDEALSLYSAIRASIGYMLDKLV